MITASDLEHIELFTSLNRSDVESLAAQASDVRRGATEFVTLEGEEPQFYILLDGEISVHKRYGSRLQKMAVLTPGAFFGEVPLLLGTRQIASGLVEVDSRFARFDPAQFRELMQNHPRCFDLISAEFNKRMAMISAGHRQVTASRVLISDARSAEDSREIRHFLSLNRIPFERATVERLAAVSGHRDGDVDVPTVLVDGSHPFGQIPTTRAVAEALGMRTSPSKTCYDVIVVGGGPAGLAAAVYGASEGLGVLLVERCAVGGQAGTSSRIENYLGFPEGISGDDLADRALRQADRLGAELVVTRRVQRMDRMADGTYCCELDGGGRISAKSIIVATGVDWRSFEAEGVERLRGKGVLYGSAKTEASAVIGKDIFIVGGGNSAGQAAVHFADFANSVTMAVRGGSLDATMSKYLINQISQKSNIVVETHTEVVAVRGKDSLETIKTVRKNPVSGDAISRGRKADVLFILIGAVAKTEWLPQDLLRDEHGFICTGQDTVTWAVWKEARQPYPLETSLPGVFCVGDVRHDSVKRVSAGVGEGSMAITFVHKYLALRQSQLACA